MVISVKNLNGTADNPVPAPYSSWIEFWKAKSGKKTPTKCPKCGQQLTDPVGAHVKKSSQDRHWYIVPICRGCNQANTSFEVEESLLVPVNE